MPMHEDITVTATLLVEIDDYRLEFVTSVRVAGARYDGKPPPPGFEGDVLEANIRAAYARAVSESTTRGDVAIGRLYPVGEGARGSVNR